MPSRRALFGRHAAADAIATPLRRAFSTSPAYVQSPAFDKLGGPAAWRGSELAESEWWGKKLTSAHLAELQKATKACMESGTLSFDGDVPIGVGKHNFKLEETAELVEAMAEELENGSGVTMLEGVPVADYSLKELGVMYLGLCSYLGHNVNQSSSGLRSKSRGFGMPLGHVKAEMRGKTPLDGKQSNNYFRLHTDRCDLITLLSVRTASKGGQGRVASAVAVHDEMLERAPELVPLLYSPIERIWEGGEGVIALPIWAVHPETGKFTTQISPSYIENAQYVNGVRKLTQDEIEAIDLIEEIGLELGHDYLQAPGQITFINNHLCYHGRTAWKHSYADEGNERDTEENGRLLLRAWVSPYNSRALPDTPEFNEMWGSVEPGVPRGGLEPALAQGLKEKPPELVEAYVSGKADYYGMYKRTFAGEDVEI